MKTISLQFVDDISVPMPERSRLYRLPPINLKHGLVESLTSYIARLAAAHCLPLWFLVTREIAPHFTRKSIVNFAEGHCDLLGKFGGAVNGNTFTAIQAANAAERLTTRTDLAQLTMLGAGERFAQTPLLRPYQAWCPMCLDECKEAKQTLHYPLIWNLVAVTTCPIHKTLLVDRCRRCNRTHYPLARQLRIGHCPHCKSWLGSRSDAKSVKQPTAWELFAAKSTVDLISGLNTSTTENGSSHFITNISEIIKSSFGGSKNAFARYVGVHHVSVGDWLLAKQKPSLKAVLLVSYRFEIPAFQLISSLLTNFQRSLIRPAHAGDDARLRPKLRRLSRIKVKRILSAALESSEFPPRSLRTLCRQAGFCQTQAQTMFPDLSRKILEHYRTYRLERRRQREFFTKMLVRSAVYEVCWSGQYPSLRKVNRKLPSKFCMREPIAKAERLAAMQELGLNPPLRNPLKFPNKKRETPYENLSYSVV
jgi:hypothetical protein